MGSVSDRGEDLVYAGTYPYSTAPTPPQTVPPPVAPAPTTAAPVTRDQLAQYLRTMGVMQGTYPRTTVNPQNNVTLSGPAPVITDPFRHMFSQKQVYRYGASPTKSVIFPTTTVDESGKPKTTYTTGTLEWWKPTAKVQYDEK